MKPIPKLFIKINVLNSEIVSSHLMGCQVFWSQNTCQNQAGLDHF